PMDSQLVPSQCIAELVGLIPLKASKSPTKYKSRPLTARPKMASTSLGSSVSSARSEEHTSELQSRFDLVCRLLLEKKKNQSTNHQIHFLHNSKSRPFPCHLAPSAHQLGTYFFGCTAHQPY